MSESTVTVKANQATTDWQDGAIFSVERTEYVDKLLENGVLSELQYDDPAALNHVREQAGLPTWAEVTPSPLTDDDAAAAGFDLDNPDALPPASADDGPLIVHAPAEDIADLKQVDITDDTQVASKEELADLAEEKPSRTKRGTSAKKSDDVGE